MASFIAATSSEFIDECVEAELNKRNLLSTENSHKHLDCDQVLDKWIKEVASELIPLTFRKNTKYKCFSDTLKKHHFDDHLFMKRYLENSPIKNKETFQEITSHDNEMKLIVGTVCFPCVVFEGLIDQSFFRLNLENRELKIQCFEKYAQEVNLFPWDDIEMNPSDDIDCKTIMADQKKGYEKYVNHFPFLLPDQRNCMLEKFDGLHLRDITLRLILLVNNGMTNEQIKEERRKFDLFYPKVYENIKTCVPK